MFLAQNTMLLRYLAMTHWLSKRFPKKKVPKTTRENILIANIAHYGDVVLSTVAIEAIKKQYPRSRISFLGSECAQTILAHHPHLQKIHTFNHWKLERKGSLLIRFMRSIVSFYKALWQLRKESYDILLDLYPYYPNASFLAYCAGITERIGYISGGWGMLYTHSIPWIEKDIHMTQYHMRLLQEVGFEANTPFVPTLYCADTKIIEEEYCIIHMGAGAKHKEWDENHWKKVIEHIKIPIIFTGIGEREKKMAERVGDGTSYIDRLSWEGFVSVVKNASYILCVDSVISHIASAFDIPTIVLMTGINNPIQWRPCHARSIVLQKKTPCFPCSRSQGCSSMDCIQKIMPEDVVKALLLWKYI